MKYVIPFIFIAIIAVAAIKKVNVFSSFTKGASGAAEFVISLLPLLACTFIMCELFERSNLSQMLSNALAPVFNFLGIPPQITKLILIKPFSGSGSLAYLTQILESYGADSYIGRCASVLYGSSETVFYISAVYFASSKQKKRIIPIVIILCATLISTIVSCLLCRIM
ncbi:MAG: nucleoside recognition domain-containing protein [Candidatus Coproplasma sp.]